MNASAPSDRRRAPRHTVRMLCQAVRERDFSLLGEVVLDLSPEGMMLRTDARPLTGEPVIVSFFEPRSSRWYDFEATIARVLHGRRPGDQGRCVALEFERTDAKTRASLRAVLAGRNERPGALRRTRAVA